MSLSELLNASCSRRRLSVVMPTARGPRLIAPAVQSILRELHGDHALFVVVNGAGADVAAWNALQSEIERTSYSASMVIMFEPSPGLLSGRHAGLAVADSEIVVFVDDDILVATGWAEAIESAFLDRSVHLVGGPSFPQEGFSSPPWVQNYWTQVEGIGRCCGYLSLLDLGTERREISAQFVWGLNFAVRRQSLIDAGGFHPDGVPWFLRRFRGDGETAVSQAFDARGWKTVYEPKAAVTHVVPIERLSVEYFERRAYLQGVSDSYARIRGMGGLNVATSRTSITQIVRSLKERIRSWRTLGHVDGRHLRGLSAEQIRTCRAYDEGFRYHQKEVFDDPLLLSWVLREHYWDFAYPEVVGL